MDVTGRFIFQETELPLSLDSLYQPPSLVALRAATLLLKAQQA